MQQEIQAIVRLTISADAKLTRENIIELIEASDCGELLTLQDISVVDLKEEKDIYGNE